MTSTNQQQPDPLSPSADQDPDPWRAITVRGLEMSYAGLHAVRGIDFEVAVGEVFAFLGPNGAGKTTTVEILEGFRQRTGGTVSVLGQDPRTAGPDWRARIGVVLQESEPEPELSVRECLTLYAGYYPDPLPVGEVLELVGLSDRAGSRTARLSGGQRRRLDVALALIGDPDLVFLDEPTTGFDPAARRATWEVIAGLRRRNKTIFLTTHFMDEAEYLADRIMIIRRGAIVAEGTPATLGGRASAPATIQFSLPDGLAATELPAGFTLGGDAASGDRQVRLRSSSPLSDVGGLADWAAGRGIELPDLQVVRPSLEEIYLGLVADDS
ncbi:MAG: ABC transporter ATP-binding protein [Jatrophihabitantaceae bacterium]